VQNENYLDNGRCEIDVRINSIELAQLRAHDALADQKFTEAGFLKSEPEPF
jgi:hypothetical protein